MFTLAQSPDEVFATKADKTEVRFTHLGLVPEFECFEIGLKAWGGYFNDSLQDAIASGTGQSLQVKKPRGNAFTRGI